MTDLLSLLKLAPDFFRPDVGTDPGDQEMIENVRTFADQAQPIAGCQFKQTLHGFLAELLGYALRAARQQPGGMADLRVGVPAAVDDSPQAIEHIGAGPRPKSVRDRRS